MINGTVLLIFDKISGTLYASIQLKPRSYTE